MSATLKIDGNEVRLLECPASGLLYSKLLNYEYISLGTFEVQDKVYNVCLSAHNSWQRGHLYLYLELNNTLMLGIYMSTPSTAKAIEQLKAGSLGTRFLKRNTSIEPYGPSCDYSKYKYMKISMAAAEKGVDRELAILPSLTFDLIDLANEILRNKTCVQKIIETLESIHT